MEAPSDDINAVTQSPETEPAETVAENGFRALGLSDDAGKARKAIAGGGGARHLFH